MPGRVRQGAPRDPRRAARDGPRRHRRSAGLAQRRLRHLRERAAGLRGRRPHAGARGMRGGALSPAARPRPAGHARGPAPPPPYRDPRHRHAAHALGGLAQRAALDRVAQGDLDPRRHQRLRLLLVPRGLDHRRAAARRPRPAAAARRRGKAGQPLLRVRRPRHRRAGRAPARADHPRSLSSVSQRRPASWLFMLRRVLPESTQPSGTLVDSRHRPKWRKFFSPTCRRRVSRA